MGIVEMKEQRLVEVMNSSEICLEERSQGASGSTVVASMEGTRPVLVEIQALISPSSFGNPRRMATGLDNNRISLLMAVLEKRDRKSTRLNSSHVAISYAVFCLKKKTRAKQ